MNLTPREREIIAALIEGKMNKQIAADHGRSICTIRTQLNGLMKKTGARTRTELAVRAVREGWA